MNLRRLEILLISTVIFLFLAASLLNQRPIYLPAPVKPPPQTPPTQAVPVEKEHYYSGFRKNPKPNAPPLEDVNSTRPPLKVTITETGGSHDEVVAALVHSFTSQPNTEVSLYQFIARYKIADIMAAFTGPPNKPPKWNHPKVLKINGMTENRPDIYVAATCELDLKFFKKEIQALLDSGQTYMVCVIHHADHWSKRELELLVAPWVASGRVEFWTLSPHTRAYMLEKSTSGWNTTHDGHQSLVRYFVPVFPVQLQDLQDIDDDLAFGIQGDYSSSRRTYKKIFNQLSSFMEASGGAEKPNVTMHLLGHGSHPDVPGNLKQNVIFDENLNYDAYYRVISHTFALVPAFANDEYLDRKASSSVPAALIGGVPLVVTQHIIDAYSYLTKEDVWLQEDDETDLDVIQRILAMKTQTRKEKKELVRQRCRRIIERNVELVGQWVGRAMDVLKNMPKPETEGK